MNRPCIFLESLASGIRTALQTAPWPQWQSDYGWTKNLAKAVWLRWSQRVEAGQRVDDLNQLLVSSDEEHAQNCEHLVQSKGQELRPEDRYRMQSALLSARDLARVHFRRQGEPRGKSTPEWFKPIEAEDLVPIFPCGIPFHRPDEPALEGKLQLSRILALNTWSETWKARLAGEVNPSEGPGRPVVLRMYSGQEAVKLMGRDRKILLEIREKLHFPNILRLLKANKSDEYAWIIHEYQGGTGLADLVNDMHHHSSREVFSRLARWAKRFAALVAKPHTMPVPHVHGLLCPDSFVVVSDSEEKNVHPVLVDWGLTPLALEPVLNEGSRVKSSWLPPGHPWFYTSPQVRRGAPPKPSDDVYSLGMIWYHMLLNDFRAPPPGDLSWAEGLMSRGFQPGHARIVSRAISASAERRPFNAAELAQAISELAKQE